MIEKEKERFHSKTCANHSFAVRLLHEFIKHPVVLIFMLTASVFQSFCDLVPMIDIVFGLGHEFVEHVVHIVTRRRLMTVRVAMGRRIVHAVVRMDVIVRNFDWAEKVRVKGGTRMREWRSRSKSGRFHKRRMRRMPVGEVGAAAERR